jgi:polyphosphate kinase
MGSADLMPRNLDNRVETLVPFQDAAIRSYMINEVLEVYLRDTAKARVLQADGSYTRRAPPPDTAPADTQALLLARATGDSEPQVPLAALPKKYRKHLSIYGRVEPLE